MPVLDMMVNVWVGCAVLPPGAHQYAVGGELAALYFNINSLPTSLQCWEKGSDSPQARSLLLRLPIKCPCQPSRHTLFDGSTDFIKKYMFDGFGTMVLLVGVWMDGIGNLRRGEV